MSQAEVKNEIGSRELRCLRVLVDDSTPMTAAKIGQRAGFAGAVGSDTFAALVRAGFVERLELNTDIREVVWRVTTAGKAEASRHTGTSDDRDDDGNDVGMVDLVARRELTADGLAVKALVPLFGSNRLLASAVGAALGGCSWVGVPFAGGLCELPYIEARTIVVNDLHCGVINLASCVADPVFCDELKERLAGLLFHQATFEMAQVGCATREVSGWDGSPDLDWAVDYFVAAWMARSGQAGTKGEFRAPFSVRWDAGGGDSAKRFRSAVAGLSAFGRMLANASFVCMDAFAFLAKCKDRRGCGIYCDPPFPDSGDVYKHRFSLDDHARLAAVLATHDDATIVCRSYDVPLVRELYPKSFWEWRRFRGRNATNDATPEVLLLRNAMTTKDDDDIST